MEKIIYINFKGSMLIYSYREFFFSSSYLRRFSGVWVIVMVDVLDSNRLLSSDRALIRHRYLLDDDRGFVRDGHGSGPLIVDRRRGEESRNRLLVVNGYWSDGLGHWLERRSHDALAQRPIHGHRRDGSADRSDGYRLNQTDLVWVDGRAVESTETPSQRQRDFARFGTLDNKKTIY